MSHQPITCTNELIPIRIWLAIGSWHVAGDILEQIRELGQQEDRDQCHHDRRDGKHDDRVDHGRACLADQSLARLKMVGQHPQGLGHAAARLGHLDHVEEHRAEGLRFLRHGFFKRRPALNRELHATQDRPQRRPRELPLQARERADEIDARAQIRSKLPAELGELARADPAEEDSLPQRRPARRGLEPAAVTLIRSSADWLRDRRFGSLRDSRDRLTHRAWPESRIALIRAAGRSTFALIRCRALAPRLGGLEVVPVEGHGHVPFREASFRWEAGHLAPLRAWRS